MRLAILVTAVMAVMGGSWALAGGGCAGCAAVTATAATTKPTIQPAGEAYSCPMGCVTSATAGKCPKCGMEMAKQAKS